MAGECKLGVWGVDVVCASMTRWHRRRSKVNVALYENPYRVEGFVHVVPFACVAVCGCVWLCVAPNVSVQQSAAHKLGNERNVHATHDHCAVRGRRECPF